MNRRSHRILLVGIATGVAIATILVASGFVQVVITVGRCQVGVAAGRVFVSIYERALDDEFVSVERIWTWRWTILAYRANYRALSDGTLVQRCWIGIPLWVFFVCDLAATAALCLRYRSRPGCCSMCGYNLTGNVSGICPECGVPIAAGKEDVGSFS